MHIFYIIPWVFLGKFGPSEFVQNQKIKNTYLGHSSLTYFSSYLLLWFKLKTKLILSIYCVILYLVFIYIKKILFLSLPRLFFITLVQHCWYKLVKIETLQLILKTKNDVKYYNYVLWEIFWWRSAKSFFLNSYKIYEFIYKKNNLDKPILCNWNSMTS